MDTDLVRAIRIARTLISYNNLLRMTLKDCVDQCDFGPAKSMLASDGTKSLEEELDRLKSVFAEHGNKV